MFKQHYDYMSLAIEEAVKSKNNNEIPIGAILVNTNNEIIAKSHNQTIIDCDPTSHAEIKLLRAAACKLQNYRLLGTTLYVTIEPCIMCMGAIIHARISTLVFGAPDKKWGAAGSLYDFTCDLRLNHKIKVIKGVCFYKCRSLIRNFFRTKRGKI